MAQERNPVGSSETAEIKSEIERTRVEMSETLGEIQDRLRPDHLLQQARDGVTTAAKGKVRNIMSSAGDTAGMVAARARWVATYAFSPAEFMMFFTFPVAASFIPSFACWRR